LSHKCTLLARSFTPPIHSNSVVYVVTIFSCSYFVSSSLHLCLPTKYDTTRHY
jgi:hypothetical protein